MPARIDYILPALALSVGCRLAAAAATPLWPTQDAIDQARQAQPFPDLQRLNRVPVPALPRITPGVPSISIEDMARKHIQFKNSTADAQSASPALRIFVTLAMPAQSLKLLVAQAERAKATLVLRGLKADSMKQTLEAVQVLIGTRKVSWNIDPEAYARYSVRHAPMFVLTKEPDVQASSPVACGASCTTASTFYSVAGDVSLDYALDTLVRRYPEARPHAAPFLQRLNVTP